MPPGTEAYLSKQGHHLTANRKPISWKEREAILAELRTDPSSAQTIAEKFNRGITTVQKLGEKARVARITERDRILAVALSRRSPADRADGDQGLGFTPGTVGRPAT